MRKRKNRPLPVAPPEPKPVVTPEMGVDILTSPMYDFAQACRERGRTSWNPVNRVYWKGFAMGLMAGADLIKSYGTATSR